MFDELDRRHLPLLYDSLHRALRDIDDENISFNQEIHCLHLGWQALATSDSALEIGGLPLAMALIEIGTRQEDFNDRFDAFCVFLSNYELLIAEPVIRIMQSLLVYQWDGHVIVDEFRSKCLTLLKSLYARLSSNPFLERYFPNEIISKTALSERNQRVWAAAFTYHEETFLDHPYLFSDSDKIALFDFWVVSHMEHQHKQGWGLRRLARHFFNLGFRFEHPQSAYFGIAAERQDLLHDVTKAITGQSISVLRRPMKVRYMGEQGIDLAGLTADLLAKVIKASISRCLEMNLFRESSGGLWFQEGADCPGEFNRLGILIGLAMYNGVKSLPLDFPLMFYKKLVGEELKPEDMKDFDPILVRGWQQLGDIDLDGLSFEYTYQAGSEVQTHVMEYEGNVPKMVTPGNRMRYIEAMFSAATDKLIAPSFNALQSGLESIIPRRVLRLFTSSQLQMLMAGQRVVDVPQTVELLKQVTVYDGYSPEDPLIRNLWSILSNGTSAQFSQFLDLITASDRIPASFPANFKLTIFRSGSDEEMYPPTKSP
jgi:ubiquitin-protein ligase E3 A